MSSAYTDPSDALIPLIFDLMKEIPSILTIEV
jgi:hypothetical protein